MIRLDAKANRLAPWLSALAAGLAISSTSCRTPQTNMETSAPKLVRAVKKTSSARDWYAVGRNDGANWAERTQRRGHLAGGRNPLAKDEVLRMADMYTSNHYSRGLRNNAPGQKRYIEGFCAGVKAVTGK